MAAAPEETGPTPTPADVLLEQGDHRRLEAESIRRTLFDPPPSTSHPFDLDRAAELADALFSPQRGPKLPMYRTDADDASAESGAEPTPDKLGFVEQLIKFFGR